MLNVCPRIAIRNLRTQLCRSLCIADEALDSSPIDSQVHVRSQDVRLWHLSMLPPPSVAIDEFASKITPRTDQRVVPALRPSIG